MNTMLRFITRQRWIVPVVLIGLAGGAAASPTIRGQIGSLLDHHPTTEVTEAPVYTVNGDTVTVPRRCAEQLALVPKAVEPHDVPRILSLTGRTALCADAVTHVHAPLTGRIVKVGPALGSVISQAGTELCVIESNDLAAAKSDYLKARVQVELDDDTFRRTHELVASGVVSEKAEFDAKNAAAKSHADLEAARQKLLVYGVPDSELASISGQTGRERTRYVVTAPRPGVILEKNVTEGELADTTLNLFTIADTSRLWVYGDVYERDWGKVALGQDLAVRFSNDPDHAILTTIDWISPVIDGATRSVRIRGTITNAEKRLLADMYCRVDVVIDLGLASLTVPTTAVARTTDGDYLFVESGDAPDGNFYQRRRVAVEAAGAGMVRVLSGLRPGERVLGRGAIGLLEEMKQP